MGIVYKFPSVKSNPDLSEMIKYGFELLDQVDHDIDEVALRFTRKYPGMIYVLEYCVEERLKK
jgi:hypothetical protein